MIMTINSLEAKNATERFNYFFKEIIKKYGISDDKINTNDITKDFLKGLIQEYNISGDDKYELMDLFHEMNEERLRQTAILGAKAAIIMRNLSHNIGKTILTPKQDSEFNKFSEFCGIDKESIKGKNKFQELLIKDSEKIKNHPLNIRYQSLREQGLSPYETINYLPRSDAMSEWDIDNPLAKSNDEALQGSKMGALNYCTGRVNTLLGILVQNEGIDYVNKHFKYAEILKDGMSDIMYEVPDYDRDKSYLNEALAYEDPHQMLIYIDDDGMEYEVDINQIMVDQLAYGMVNLNNVIKKYNGNVGDVAYEIYFLNFINEELRKNRDNPNKDLIIKRLENYNKSVGGSETIIKWLISHAIETGNEKMEKNILKN